MPFIGFLLGPIGRYLLIAAAVGGTFLYGRQHYINIGYAKAMHAIAAQDQKAVEASKEAKGNVDACFDSGGFWDIEAGTCAKKEPK